MDAKINRSWFEMKDLRRRRMSNVVWIPLRQSETISNDKYGHDGFREEFVGSGSVMVPLDLQEKAESLGWGDIGPSHFQCHWATKESYKPAEAFQVRDDENLGVELILCQNFDGAEPAIWHLNQDLVFALGLLREGDKWVRPEEDYIEVVRLKRDNNDRPILFEIRAEHLKDYLAARGMRLRIARFLSREGVFQNTDQFGWGEGLHADPENSADVRFEIHVNKIHEGGFPYGGKKAVFHFQRNDIDPNDDVPIMGPETNENVTSESWTFDSEGSALFRIEGEFWINEWIEPSAHSPRVRRDDVPSSCEFIVDASGERMNADDLDDEDIGRWLWFRSDVFEAATKRRGARFEWFTRDTGSITPLPGYSIHFGINESHLLTIYASDIGRLPEWLRRFWVGYNVAPEGKVSHELLQSQVQATPASSKAPEPFFSLVLERLDYLSEERWGEKLFRSHADQYEIAQTVNRFRATSLTGLYSLAKDISRLVADRINIELLHKIAPPEKGTKLGSLKSLERVLAEITCNRDEAKSILTPLVGVYELRLADAHLPSSKVSDALRMAQINETSHPLDQGFQLIESTVVALQRISLIIDTSNTENE